MPRLAPWNCYAPDTSRPFPVPTSRPPAKICLATLKMGVHMMRQADYITDYEVKLGGKIAEVLCGGNVTPGTPVSEQYILDLEREGFKSLCGEKKTQERIQYTLKTGKTLEELNVTLFRSSSKDPAIVWPTQSKLPHPAYFL